MDFVVYLDSVTLSILLSSLDRSNSLFIVLGLPPPTATPFAAAEQIILVGIAICLGVASEITTTRIYKVNASSYTRETNNKNAS